MSGDLCPLCGETRGEGHGCGKSRVPKAIWLVIRHDPDAMIHEIVKLFKTREEAVANAEDQASMVSGAFTWDEDVYQSQAWDIHFTIHKVALPTWIDNATGGNLD